MHTHKLTKRNYTYWHLHSFICVKATREYWRFLLLLLFALVFERSWCKNKRSDDVQRSCCCCVGRLEHAPEMALFDQIATMCVRCCLGFNRGPCSSSRRRVAVIVFRSGRSKSNQGDMTYVLAVAARPNRKRNNTKKTNYIIIPSICAVTFVVKSIVHNVYGGEGVEKREQNTRVRL